MKRVISKNALLKIKENDVKNLTIGSRSELYKAAWDKGYQAGFEAAQPKWISVKDNPPDGTKEVIACNMYGEMLIGHVLAMSNGKDYYCETLQDNIYNVTHWMSRPKPPKEEA